MDNERDALSGCKYGFALSNKEHGEDRRGSRDIPVHPQNGRSKPAVRKPAQRPASKTSEGPRDNTKGIEPVIVRRKVTVREMLIHRSQCHTPFSSKIVA